MPIGQGGAMYATEYYNELWSCADCLQMAPLSDNGVCATCGSAAVFSELVLADECAA